MTDNEIINVLNNEIACIKRQVGQFCDNKRDCLHCDLVMKDEDIVKAYESVIDLINRQKAEIKRYLHSIKLLENDVATAKSEAIKEFAERLKYRADKTRIKNIETEKIVFYMDEFKLDNLVKEMTEVNENDRA